MVARQSAQTLQAYQDSNSKQSLVIWLCSAADLCCPSPLHVLSSVLGCVGIQSQEREKQETSEAAAAA